MNKYNQSIKKIQENIQKKLSLGNHVVVIGENSAGKSDVLKKIVQNYCNSTEKIYFIDAVNRKFNVSLVSQVGQDFSINSEDIVSLRLSESKFNLVDSFGLQINNVESLYATYKNILPINLKEFAGIDFKIEQRVNDITGTKSNYVVVNGNEVFLSNGYQAIVRIFIELIQYEEHISPDAKAIVLIDEIDKYLSPSYTAKIFPYLQERFPLWTFCVTTHSRDLLKYASNYILCPLKQNNEGVVQYEFLSSLDIHNEKQIERIFSDIFFESERKSTSSNDEMDIRLRQFLNLKLTDSWDDNCEREFKKIESELSAPHQKLLYRQIREW